MPPTKIETDSYVAVQLIEQKRALDFSSLRYMAETIEGSFTFTVLDAEESLYIVKGDSPFCLYHFPQTGLLVYASTEEILGAALYVFGLPAQSALKIHIESGELVEIGRNGKLAREKFDDTKQYQRVWAYPGLYRGCVCMPRSYPDELKDVPAWMGYPPELVDHLIHCGHAPEEIEEMLYAGEI